MCHDEIGTVCSNYRHRCSFKSEHNWEGLCDHLKTRRIFTFNICVSTSMLLGLIMCVNCKRSPDETNFNRIQPSNPIVVLDVGFTYLPLGRERGKMVIIIIAYLSREVSYYYYTTHPWMGKRGKGSLFVMNSEDNSILLWALTRTCWTLGVCTVEKCQRASERVMSPPIVLLKAVHIFHISPFQLVASSTPFHPCGPSPTIFTQYRSKSLVLLIGLAFSRPTAVLFVVLSEKPAVDTVAWWWIFGLLENWQVKCPRGGDVLCLCFGDLVWNLPWQQGNIHGLSWSVRIGEWVLKCHECSR